ncbi:MAG: efflux RND transporter permease subunit [Helicobacter sp.]|nr:efflux RND transporter permease subunit [Helicobacter sp.]
MIRTLKFCLHNPMVVLVCVIFAMMFGILGLKSMPYQLMPQVSKPTISVYTNWNGATPYEVESCSTTRVPTWASLVSSS